MIRLTQEQSEALSMLKSTPSFYRFTKLLTDEAEFCRKGLMTASLEKVGQLQGRAKLLDELLELIQDIK